MSRIFVTGDCHGDFNFLLRFCHENDTKRGDTLIILGDSGILYGGEGNYYEKTLKEVISKCPITLFCIRGNHDDKASLRSDIQTDIFWGEQVYVDPACPNVKFSKDVESYTTRNGKKILVLGGAYSVDKYYRIANMMTWFPYEQLTEEQRMMAEELYSGQHYDYVMTHTCPRSWQPTDLFIGGVTQSTVDTTMEDWMGQFKDTIDFDKWLFGHYHDDRKDMFGDGKVDMYFHDIHLIEEN